MKYLYLVYLDENRLDELPGADCVAYDRLLRESGYCLASEALQSVRTATTVRVCNGKPAIPTCLRNSVDSWKYQASCI